MLLPTHFRVITDRRNAANKQRRSTECKTCAAARSRKWHADNRERACARMTAYIIARADTPVKNPRKQLIDGKKQCFRCLEWKLLDEYYPNQGSAFGRHSWCKPCARADALRAYHADPAKARAHALAWTANNRERCRGYVSKSLAKKNARLLCSSPPPDPVI